MTLLQLYREAIDRLIPYKSASEARQTVLLIFEHLKNWTQTDILIKGEEEVTPWLIEQVDSIVTRILAGEPVQYIIGTAHFYGLIFKVTPDVLIPRPETAELVDMIVKENHGTDLRVLDIATGSGCIAITLSRNLKFPEIDAFDISDEAIAIAKENSARLKTKINFFHQDILDLKEPPHRIYDIIVSNPPYIALKEAQSMDCNVLDHEPVTALFVPDNDPLKFYKPISRYALKALKKDGALYLEINP